MKIFENIYFLYKNNNPSGKVLLIYKIKNYIIFHDKPKGALQ